MKLYRVRICTLPVRTQEGDHVGHNAVAYVVASSRRQVWSVLRAKRPKWVSQGTSIEQEYPTTEPWWLCEVGPMTAPFSAVVRAINRRAVKRALLKYWATWPNCVAWINDGAWKCVTQIDVTKPGVY